MKVVVPVCKSPPPSMVLEGSQGAWREGVVGVVSGVRIKQGRKRYRPEGIMGCHWRARRGRHTGRLERHTDEAQAWRRQDTHCLFSGVCAPRKLRQAPSHL